jgi:hypothetical protein
MTMKKYTLMAATAAFVLVPFTAHANWYDKSKNTQTRPTEQRAQKEMRDRDEADFKVRVESPESITLPSKTDTRRVVFPLADTSAGESVEIQGEKIYLVQNNGYKYFAPNGSYTTRNGITFVAEDGLILRAESPDKVVYVDTDFIDTDKDGYSNEMNTNVKTYRQDNRTNSYR